MKHIIQRGGWIYEPPPPSYPLFKGALCQHWSIEICEAEFLGNIIWIDASFAKMQNYFFKWKYFQN